MFCNKCGNELNENDKFCNKCGSSITVNDISKRNSKKTAIIISAVIILIAILVVAYNINNFKKGTNINSTSTQSLYSKNSNTTNVSKINQIKNTVDVKQNTVNNNITQNIVKKTAKEKFEEYGYVECKLEFKNNINNIVDNFNNINYTNIKSEVDYSVYYMEIIIGTESYQISSLYFDIFNEYQVQLCELKDIMKDEDNNILYIKEDLYNKIQTENGKLKTQFTVKCRGTFNYEVETLIKKDQINVIEINEENYLGAVFG